jgi:hypothetical protein
MSRQRPGAVGRLWGPPWTGWKVAGMVLAGLVAVGGLVVFGFFVALYVSLSSVSNK